MPVSSYLRKFVVYVDGYGKIGDCDGATLPKLTLKMDEFRGGGMDIPVEVDLGMERLEFQFTMTSIDDQVIDKFGLFPGQQKAFTVRGSLASHDGTSMAVVGQMRGTLKSVDMGDFRAGEKVSVTFMVALDYYKLTRGDRVLIEIDIENVRRIVGGVDQLEKDRIALGL
jgi:hypothetical protein